MNQMIKVIVIDDEPHSRDELKHLLEKFKDIQIIDEADSGEKGLEKIIVKEPDVIFVDIDMPNMTGMELVEVIQKVKKVPFVIFATAYTDYAVKAFRFQALDYLLKPFDEEQVEETMARIRRALNSVATQVQSEPTTAKLAVEDEGRIVYINPTQIIFLFREERETVICTNKQRYISRRTLKELEQKLKDYPFFRVHKSYLVNLDKIESLIPWFNGAYELKVLDQREKIPVSRNYVKALRERLEL